MAPYWPKLTDSDIYSLVGESVTDLGKEDRIEELEVEVRFIEAIIRVAGLLRRLDFW